MHQDYGNELWRSDGTAAGTYVVKDLNPGTKDSYPLYMIPYDAWLLFSDQIMLGTLWRTNGTDVGTQPVQSFRPNLFSGGPPDFVVFDGRVYFSAYTGAHGAELWTTDGTKAGTFDVADIVEGPASSTPAGMTVLGNQIIFTTVDKVWAMDEGAFSLDVAVEQRAMPDTELGV